MCTFCKENEKIGALADEAIFSMDNDGDLMVSVFSEEQKEFKFYFLPTKFCPICGEKVNVNTNDRIA